MQHPGVLLLKLGVPGVEMARIQEDPMQDPAPGVQLQDGWDVGGGYLSLSRSIHYPLMRSIYGCCPWWLDGVIPGGCVSTATGWMVHGCWRVGRVKVQVSARIKKRMGPIRPDFEPNPPRFACVLYYLASPSTSPISAVVDKCKLMRYIGQENTPTRKKYRIEKSRLSRSQN